MAARPGSGIPSVGHVGGGSAPSPLSYFSKLRKLGEGGFGKVFLVRDSRDGVTYVMKEIDLSKLDAKGRKEATKECAFLRRMRYAKRRRTVQEGCCAARAFVWI